MSALRTIAGVLCRIYEAPRLLGAMGHGAQLMNHIERLRCLAINDPNLVEDLIFGSGDEAASELDAKTLALVRLAALVAIGGAQPSYGALADAAVDAGASAAEMVGVLANIAPVVGLPSVVAAAPNLATALGYDLDEALDR